MTKKLESFLTGTIVFIILAALRNKIPLHNMVFYLTACILFVLTAAGTYLLLQRREPGSDAKEEPVLYMAAVAGLILWIVLYYLNETGTENSLAKEALLRHTMPFPLWIGIMLAGSGLCLLLLRRGRSILPEKRGKYIRALVAVLFAVGTSVQFYAPNIFRDVQGGVYHSHAYTNSIINVCWMIPYSKNLETLYGHYAIFYMPVLRILHKFFQVDYLTGIFLVTAVIAGISVLLFAYVLDHFAKSDLLFYLAMLGIGEYYFMILQGGVYMQVHPHRMIFPIALTALALREKKRGKKYDLAAMVLIGLSFVWSTEVGMVIMFAFALYRWVEKIMDGKPFSVKKGLSLWQELLLFVLVPFALAWLIINGYNLAAGGNILDMREFFYPLISDRNYISLMELPLPNAAHAYVGATILFMGGVMLAVYRVLFPAADEKEKENEAFFFLLGIMNLGLMLYYINRPTEGCIFITMYLMLIMQVMILERCRKELAAGKQALEGQEVKKPIRKKPSIFLYASLQAITVFLLFIMAFDSVYSMPKAWKTSAETIWKTDDLKEFAQNIWLQIPPDAMAFGEGVPELMALIDRDTHLHTTEWSYLNMPLDTMEYARKELEDTDWFFCNMFSLYYMQSNYPGLTDQFYLHEEFEYNGEKFGFYRREE